MNFRRSWLWRHSFEEERLDANAAEQEYFKNQYHAMRDRAAILTAQIAKSMPMLTVHDIVHLDAL